MPHPTTRAVLDLFRVRGTSQYGREAVTQLEHALQAAMFAERDEANAPLIAAALLHDVGHLVHSLPDDAPEQGIDDHHETAAANWLAKRFGPEVVEPVRMHVAAKRYLCTVEPAYRELLSGPSLVSLELQGGLLNETERAAFEASPYCAAAVRLRRWDDAAKVIGLATPPLEHFADYVDRCAI
jgi:phosphonate degradation associated HDIG domain protein